MESSFEQTRLADYYEFLLLELSEDLHERYAQLLTSVLAYMEFEGLGQKEAKSILRYTIDDMRSRSKEIFPHVSEQKTTYLDIRSYLRVLEKKYGIPISYTGENTLSLGQMRSFRQLQLIVTVLIEHFPFQGIQVEVSKETWKVAFTLEESGSLQEEFIYRLSNWTDNKASLTVQERQLIWEWKRREDEHDPHIDRR